MGNREQLIEVFQDMEKWCKEDKKLAEAIHRARRDTKVYGEDACPKFPCSKEGLVTEGTVIADRSFQAAIRKKMRIRECGLQFTILHRPQIRDVRYTDTCIYSPGILIIRTDTSIP